MCGIVGEWRRRGEVDAEALRRACDRLQHRGPDHADVLVHGRCGFGHTRLSIIDLAGGDQPLRDTDDRVCVIANGEVYNHVELRAELEADGAGYRSGSDCEAIVHGYRRWGADVVDRLQGMYAFALHDRDTDELWLARDRLGIKPLYYAVDGERLLFASEIKALLSMLSRRPSVHPPALSQYLHNQFAGGRETIFAGIHRVLPGERLRVSAELQLRHESYWTPTAARQDFGDEAEAREAFDELFGSVMHDHMRSDVPFGLFLSGGVDSAVLLAMLDKLGAKGLRTWSVGWADAQMKDEIDDAKRIADHIGSNHTTLRLNRDEVFGRAVRSIWAADDLMRDYASLPTLMLSEAAGAELKVVFSGEGGDEAFGGYRRYFKHPLERALRSLIAPGTGGFRVHGQLDERWLRRASGPALRSALGAGRAAFVERWRASPGDWTATQRSQFADLTSALPDNLLVKADRMMMSCSLEGRVPFLDHRVVEFGLGLPDAWKQHRGQGKAFLKRWAERYLPADHLWQKKRGFYVPVREWLGADFIARLKQPLLDSPAIREWFRPEPVAALLDAQMQTGKHSRECWSLMQFAIWHRLFVDGDDAVPGFDEDPVAWVAA